MPLYDFACLDCDTVTELFVSHELRPMRITCPECQVGEAEYVVCAPSQFKIAIDGGGRKGYKTLLGDGRRVVQSQTRLNWEHNIGNTPAAELKKDPNKANVSGFTKEYQRKIESDAKTKVDHFFKTGYKTDFGDK